MNVTFRPIEQWPEPGFEPHKDRPASQYKSTWTRTLEILEYELWRLDSESVVISLALTDRDIRRDGWPREKAKPEHPGVILEFQTADGWQRYFNDLYADWHHNVHDTALLLQDLRAVGRRGAARGQQYTGFLELAAPADGIAEAERTLMVHAGFTPGEFGEHGLDFTYRIARRRAHPDAGGSNEAFNEVQEAWRVLGGGR